MAKGTREIRRKIKSIKNTRQITKAMELVAASKMRRAVANTLALRPYARISEALLRSLADRLGKGEEGDALHPLLEKREVKRVLVVVISTDKGLCGGLNTQLFRRLNEYLKNDGTKRQIPHDQMHFIAVGRKAQDFLRRLGKKVIGAYPAMSNHPRLVDTFPISRMILADYSSGAYDKVMIVYTDFVSAIKQQANVRRLLPLSSAALEEMVEALSTKKETEVEQTPLEYKFEPSPHEVLNMLLPRLTEMQIFSAVLEAAASEHSARMFAMRNASDNAAELIDEFTLMYNQLRQASITAELAEISAGRAALG